MSEEVIQDTLADDTDKGMQTLVRTLPEFSVVVYGEDGTETTKEYRFRPLGLNDAVKALRVISAASQYINRMAASGASMTTGNEVALMLLAAVPYAERDFKDLIAGALQFRDGKGKWAQVTINQFEDYEWFPLEATIDVVDALGKHPDLAAFVKNVRKLSSSPLMATIQESVRDSQKPIPTN